MPAQSSKQRERTRAPRGTLSPKSIVQAATAILDADGLDGLTTRRLADQLGVQPTSLYTHFRDKQAIIDAVSTDILGQMGGPMDESDPIERLRQTIAAYFDVLVAHPFLVQLDAMVDDSNPAELRFSERVYACLHELELSHRDSMGALATFLRFTLGSALLYPKRRGWDEDDEHWERVRSRWANLPSDAYPAMREFLNDFPTFTQREAFEFGLNTLLGCIARS